MPIKLQPDEYDEYFVHVRTPCTKNYPMFRSQAESFKWKMVQVESLSLLMKAGN